MSTHTKKTYTLGKIKQLIDLNDDSVNFDLSFKVTCHDDTIFQMLVVDLTTLDNTPQLEYKDVKNTISGNIVADKNVYQNYFLILKSDKVCKVDVETTKKVLPKTPTHDDDPSEQSPVEQGSVEKQSDNWFTAFFSKFNWKKIGIISAVIAIGGLLVWYY